MSSENGFAAAGAVEMRIRSAMQMTLAYLFILEIDGIF